VKSVYPFPIHCLAFFKNTVYDYASEKNVENEQEVTKMSTATLTTIVEPLVRRKLFATTEEAMLELMQDYTLRQISSYQSQIAELERKYGK